MHGPSYIEKCTIKLPQNKDTSFNQDIMHMYGPISIEKGLHAPLKKVTSFNQDTMHGPSYTTNSRHHILYLWLFFSGSLISKRVVVILADQPQAGQTQQQSLRDPVQHV